MDNETLRKDTETSMSIASLIGSGTIDDLPALYDLILENINIATNEEISILLKAMETHEPKTAPQRKKQAARKHLEETVKKANAPHSNINSKAKIEEAITLLKAAGRPKALNQAQLAKQEIQRLLAARLAFASSTQTDLDFKSHRQEIFKWAKQLQPQDKNTTEQFIKNLYNEGKYEELYKRVHRLFYAKSESHYPKPLRNFKPEE